MPIRRKSGPDHRALFYPGWEAEVWELEAETALSGLVDLMSAGITFIKPVFDPQSDTGVSYPDADAAFGTKGRQTEEVLERLHQAGVLKRVLLDVVRACPRCGFLDVEVKDVCPKCKSSRIVSTETGMLCKVCGTTFNATDMMLSCVRCGHTFRQENTRFKPLYAYILAKRELSGPTRPRTLEFSGKLTLNEPIGEELRKTMEGLVSRIEKAVQELIEVNREMMLTKARGEGEVEKGVVQRAMRVSDALRRTLSALQELKRATAEEVSAKTGRARSLESVYLNHLTQLGLVRKIRVGKKVVFEPLEPGSGVSASDVR
jgi:predicted Zn-ribbon and HTH transcriptional regulator/DNA-binding transcriptional ArsR family regulator